MKNASPDVDHYIENAAPFARPILRRIRRAFHKAHPEVREAMKWSFPHFEHKGVVGSMAAFKAHVSWGFWKARLMRDPKGILPRAGETTSMGGVKVTAVSELPPEEVMIEYVREAVRLNEEGVKAERRPKTTSRAVQVPPALANALRKAPAAKRTFTAMSPSQRREYAEWIAVAKQDATRERRVKTAIEWLSEGKTRNWKYERKR